MKKILLFIFLAATPCLADNFSVQSSSWQDGQTIKNDYVLNTHGCTGGNISPEISWSNAPQETNNFMITIYDPDAQGGKGWMHWSLYNVPANVSEIKEGASLHPEKLPASAVEGPTSFGKPGYGGACPPIGDKPHHYILTVVALNKKILAKASLTAIYGR